MLSFMTATNPSAFDQQLYELVHDHGSKKKQTSVHLVDVEVIFVSKTIVLFSPNDCLC